MHLDEETVQRLLHDELEDARGAAARIHLSECGECRALLAQASQEENEMHERAGTCVASPAF